MMKKVLHTALALLVLALAGASAWTARPAAASAMEIPVTPTLLRPFAQVGLVKPTYTPSPTPLPTPTLVPTATPEPVRGGNKSILVSISEQHMYVYEGDTIVFSFVASTGMQNATRIGEFSVLDKIPNAYGATWDLWMPNWLGIYYSGTMENGIHALPILSNGVTLWEGYLGTPISFGCVVLGTYESKLLYDWVEIGTPVVIQR